MNRLKKYSPILPAIMAALLSACGDGGGGDGSGGSAACQSISGGTSHVTSTGPVSNVAAAADGDLYSFASLNLSASSQSASIRATAQSGVVFPAGSRAGAFVTFRNQGSANVTTIRTYLSGAPVETANPSNSIFEPANGGTDAGLYSGFVTSSPFDAVEFMETDSGSSGSPDYRVYEICSDGHV